MKDKEFQTSQKVLNGKAIELQQKYGKGMRKRKTDALTEKDEEKIWRSGLLEGNDPVSLNH